MKTVRSGIQFLTCENCYLVHALSFVCAGWQPKYRRYDAPILRSTPPGCGGTRIYILRGPGVALNRLRGDGPRGAHRVLLRLTGEGDDVARGVTQQPLLHRLFRPQGTGGRGGRRDRGHADLDGRLDGVVRVGRTCYGTRNRMRNMAAGF